MVTEQEVEAIGRTLVDTAQPLPARFRALFTLRSLGGRTAVDWISRAFGDGSALLKHELAYCLGQMQDEAAIPVLIRVLEDTGQEPMVRHEAGTMAAPAAMGAREGSNPQVGLAGASPPHQTAGYSLIWLGFHGLEIHEVCNHLTASMASPAWTGWPNLPLPAGRASSCHVYLPGCLI